MEELMQKPTDLRNVRLANYLQKKSSSFPGGWGKRYVVLSANFIFVYKTPSDNKPRRVICVDDCTVKPNDDFKGVANAFTIITRAKQPYHFGAETADDRGKWLQALSNAGYSSMYTRTREAVKFLEKCKELMAPLAIAIEQAVEQGKPAEEAALTASTDGLPEPDVEARKTGMTGADVVAVLGQVRSAQGWASSTLSALRSRVSNLETEINELQADLDEEARGRDEAQATVAVLRREMEDNKKAADMARQSAAASSNEVASLSSRVAELSASNVELGRRVEELSRDLTAATAAAARAARAVANGSEGQGLGGEDNAALRARVANLEAAIAREREAMGGQVRALQQALQVEQGKMRSSAAGVGGSPLQPPASPPPRNGTFSGSSPNGVASASGVATSSGAGVAASHLSMGQGQPAQVDPSVLYEREWAPFLAEANRLEREGNFVDAEQQYEAVLSAKRDRCGPESAATAQAHRDLGRVLALQRRFDRAEEHYMSSVRLCTALLGEAHPNTACALTDLAAVLREQGKFDAAERFASRAVDSLRAGVGPDDVSTATALYNLAGLAKRQGKYPEAEKSYGEALRIFKERLGDGQGETADTLYQMGCLYRKRNEFSKASSYFSQAADSYSKTYGPGDKRVAEAAKRARSMQDKVPGAR